MTSEDKYWRTQLLSATPKGAFILSLLEAGLIEDTLDEKAHKAWGIFEYTINNKAKKEKENEDFMRKLP